MLYPETDDTYDFLSRLLTERADATAFPDEVGITFTYGALGRIETMVDASGTTTYDYDKRGNLLSKTNAVGTLTYTYDATNNLKSTASGSTGGSRPELRLRWPQPPQHGLRRRSRRTATRARLHLRCQRQLGDAHLQ